MQTKEKKKTPAKRKLKGFPKMKSGANPICFGTVNESEWAGCKICPHRQDCEKVV